MDETWSEDWTPKSDGVLFKNGFPTEQWNHLGGFTHLKLTWVNINYIIIVFLLKKKQKNSAKLVCRWRPFWCGRKAAEPVRAVPRTCPRTPTKKCRWRCAFWQGQGWIRDGGFVSHGGSPKSSFWNQIFQYKPATVLGIPHFRKPPYVDLKNFKDI